MSVSNYQELKTAIQEWSKRTDSLSVSDTFISLAERDIAETMKVRELERRATNSTTTTSRYIALPALFQKMRRLQIVVEDSYIDLDFEAPRSLSVNPNTGIPRQFTITSQIELDRIPDQIYTIEMEYFAEIAPITAANPTNDILTKYPNIYLAGCMRHFGEWALQHDVARYWANNFDKAVASANRLSRAGRYGPSPVKKVSGGGRP